MSRKNTFIKGTLYLTIASLLTRIMGFFYRIFLSNSFGEEGVGLYQLIIPVYSLCFSIICSGIQVSLSRLIAAKHSKKTYLISALIITLITSVILTLFLQYNADSISLLVLHETRCEKLLILLSYALPFSAIHSCITGYYIGKKEIHIPAMSQLFEQMIRISSVILMYYIFTPLTAGGISLAVIGLVIGEISSSFYCIYKHRSGHFFAPVMKISFHEFLSSGKELLLFSLPLTANRVLLNVLQSLEAVSIPTRLKMYGFPSNEALSVYGVLNGMALPCILFPSAITNSVSTMLLPAIAELQVSSSNSKKMIALIQKIYISCFSLGSLCCLALLVTGEFIGEHIFHSPIAGSFITTLAWICPFLYTNTSLISVINGIGKTNVTFLFHSLSFLIRIISVFYFIPIYGIRGYLAGLLVSQLFLFLISSYYLSIYVKKIA